MQAVIAMQSAQAMHALPAVWAKLAGMAWSRTGRRFGAVVVREGRHAWGGGSAVESGEQGVKRSPCRRY